MGQLDRIEGGAEEDEPLTLDEMRGLYLTRVKGIINQLDTYDIEMQGNRQARISVEACRKSLIDVLLINEESGERFTKGH